MPQGNYADPLRFKVAPSEAVFPYDGAPYITFEGGIPASVISNYGQVLAFSPASVGPNNPTTNVVDRIPLPFNFTIYGVAYICQTMYTGCLFNIVMNDAAETSQVQTGATALAGQTLFANDNAVPAPGVCGYTAFTAGSGLFPQQSWLSLRVFTPVQGGVGLLKVTIFGQVS